MYVMASQLSTAQTLPLLHYWIHANAIISNLKFEFTFKKSVAKLYQHLHPTFNKRLQPIFNV